MKKSLNYLLVGTMLLLCLTNCKTYKESLAEVSYNPMNNRLENMVVNSNGYSDYQRIISDYALKDVEKNMVSKNYLNNNENLGRINIEVKGGIIPGAWNTISWCMTPLYLIPEILMLFGVPTGNYTSTLTATFSIYDKFDNQIASYTYENKKSWNNGFYYGKSPKRFAIDTAKEFMKNFRNDYDKDFNQICANLKNPQNNNKQNTYLAKTTSKSKNETLGFKLR